MSFYHFARCDSLWQNPSYQAATFARRPLHSRPLPLIFQPFMPPLCPRRPLPFAICPRICKLCIINLQYQQWTSWLSLAIMPRSSIPKQQKKYRPIAPRLAENAEHLFDCQQPPSLIKLYIDTQMIIPMRSAISVNIGLLIGCSSSAFLT
mgnify:CR=1 FL=1